MSENSNNTVIDNMRVLPLIINSLKEIEKVQIEVYKKGKDQEKTMESLLKYSKYDGVLEGMSLVISILSGENKLQEITNQFYDKLYKDYKVMLLGNGATQDKIASKLDFIKQCEDTFAENISKLNLEKD